MVITGKERELRATVFLPEGSQPLKGNWTNATSTEVDVETIDGLLDELTKTAPQGTRVIAHHNGTTHFLLGQHGWETVLRVVA
jgi:hypothetical protein